MATAVLTPSAETVSTLIDMNGPLLFCGPAAQLTQRRSTPRPLHAVVTVAGRPVPLTISAMFK